MSPSKEDKIHLECIKVWNLMCLLTKCGLVKNPDWGKLEIAFRNDWARKNEFESN